MAVYDYYDAGFPGMKVDSGDDRVESFPVKAPGLAFGVMCGTDATGALVAGPGTKLRGGTVHSHAVRGQANATTGEREYTATECASVMARGLLWMRVTASGAVTADGPVSYAANGTVANAGANVAPNCVFRSGIVTTAEGVNIAQVEFHNPFSETDTVTP